MRTGTEPIVVGTNFERKVSQMLEKMPGAIKINVLYKTNLLRADTENISVHLMNKLLQTLFAVPVSVYLIFAIKLRKLDIGYPNSVVNAGKHPTKWRRATELYLFSHSTHKTTESKV